jgi:hypothetical protein
MKRIAVVIIAALMVLLAGCSDFVRVESSYKLSEQVRSDLQGQVRIYGPNKNGTSTLIIDAKKLRPLSGDDLRFIDLLNVRDMASLEFHEAKGHPYMTEKLKDQANSKYERASRLNGKIESVLKDNGIKYDELMLF